MIDIVQLLLLAGNGGHGKVSFRREKYVPKGGPDGGDGGDGGSIIIRASTKHATLAHFSGVKLIKADNGQLGGKRKRHGANGEDTILEVPLGTIVWEVAGKYIAQRKTKKKYYLENEGAGTPDPERETIAADLNVNHHQFSKQPEGEDKRQLARLTEEGQELVVCRGGLGGRGNVAFKGPANTTPLEAEFGNPGQQRSVVLELELLADIGLVGLPNAGKSTFISRVTKARPKIAQYPFTTIAPNLGIWQLNAGESGEHKTMVVADIPGLIEGASQGKGLGHDFLRHVKGCRILIFFIYLPEEIIFDQDITIAKKVKEAWQQYQLLQGELQAYSSELALKPQIVVFNKGDIYDENLRAALIQYFSERVDSVVPVLTISGATGEGIEHLERLLIPHIM